MMQTVSRALKKHKRKLLIGGIAIAATAGILGGTIYGGLYNQPDYKNQKLEQFLPLESVKKEIATQQIKKEIKKEIKSEKIKQEIQYDKPLGVFEKMSNGAASDGNYGGGGGGTSGGGYGSYQKAFQAAARTFRKTTRKRRRSKKKHINKRSKKTKRHFRRNAF